MTIPGANLLGMASRLIKLDAPMLVAFKGEEKSHGGVVSPTYFTPRKIRASMQPVSKSMYEKLGLDLQKDYMMAYTDQVLRDLKRGASPDLLDFGGRRYQVESNTNWQNSDGWQGSLVCDIGAVPA